MNTVTLVGDSIIQGQLEELWARNPSQVDDLADAVEDVCDGVNNSTVSVM